MKRSQDFLTVLAMVAGSFFCILSANAQHYKKHHDPKQEWGFAFNMQKLAESRISQNHTTTKPEGEKEGPVKITAFMGPAIFFMNKNIYEMAQYDILSHGFVAESGFLFFKKYVFYGVYSSLDNFRYQYLGIGIEKKIFHRESSEISFFFEINRELNKKENYFVFGIFAHSKLITF